MTTKISTGYLNTQNRKKKMLKGPESNTLDLHLVQPIIKHVSTVLVDRAHLAEWKPSTEPSLSHSRSNPAGALRLCTWETSEPHTTIAGTFSMAIPLPWKPVNRSNYHI